VVGESWHGKRTWDFRMSEMVFDSKVEGGAKGGLAGDVGYSIERNSQPTWGAGKPGAASGPS
jgi:hypothetical protein